MSLPNTRYVALNCIFSIPVLACYVCPLVAVLRHFTAELYSFKFAILCCRFSSRCMPDVSTDYLLLAEKVTKQDGRWQDCCKKTKPKQKTTTNQTNKNIPEMLVGIELVWLASGLMHRS